MTIHQTIVLMLLGHLVADFNLQIQGKLDKLKQIKWWRDQTTASKYRLDYIAGLVCHSLYWAIFICAPFWSSKWFLAAVLCNTVVHAVIDDLKCNRFKLNLIQDQILHVAQMAVTLCLMQQF